jgi:hypothetical protein
VPSFFLHGSLTAFTQNIGVRHAIVLLITSSFLFAFYLVVFIAIRISWGRFQYGIWNNRILRALQTWTALPWGDIGLAFYGLNGDFSGGRWPCSPRVRSSSHLDMGHLSLGIFHEDISVIRIHGDGDITIGRVGSSPPKWLRRSTEQRWRWGRGFRGPRMGSRLRTGCLKAPCLALWVKMCL